jgi:regulator of protease activity HflC (stomatin/prohibitin superfamily)
MIKHVGIYVISAVVVLSLVAYTVFDPVAYDEIHVVRTFGRTSAVWDGSDQAGLHLKWPWPIQSVRIYDGRIFTLEDAGLEVITSDGMLVLVELTCQWSIDQPRKFVDSPETVDEAQVRIRNRLRDAVRELNDRDLADFVNLNPDLVKMDRMSEGIKDGISPGLMEDYGIEVAAVAIKSLTLTETVAETIVTSQREERQAKAKEYEGVGEARATAIRTLAEQQAQMIRDFARRKAGEIRAKGELASTKYYDAFKEAPEFSTFLRSLEALETSLRKGAVLFIDGDMLPGVNFWRSGPQVRSPEELVGPRAARDSEERE